MDEQRGKRHVLRMDGENYYLYVSNTDIMFSGPGESDIKYQEAFEAINLICRLTSKARKLGLSWHDVLKQFDSVSIHGNRTTVAVIAQAIRETGFIDAECI